MQMTPNEFGKRYMRWLRITGASAVVSFVVGELVLLYDGRQYTWALLALALIYLLGQLIAWHLVWRQRS